MNLRDLLVAVAAGLPGVETTTGPEGSITWSSNAVAFAALRADDLTAEFHLGPAIAAAAGRTPEVMASKRGPDWVTFAPAVLDDHGADRAGAWFASAYRRVAGLRAR